jgi:hypothetical protein
MGCHRTGVSRCGILTSLFGITEMNIQTVADNLRNTIAGKEDLLAVFTKPENYDWLPQPDKTARDAVNAFLKINIDELKRVLQDVEQCIGIEE